MIKIFLSAFLLIAWSAAFGQFPISTPPPPMRHSQDYPLQAPFRYEDADRVTALSIVECLSPGKLEERSFMGLGQDAQGLAPAKPRPAVWAETVRVVDSTGLSEGAIVRIVVHETPEVAYPMVPGRRYLVLASLSNEGRLETPYLSGFREGYFVAPAKADEITGLAVFETRATALDGSPDLADKIANSVVDCVPGADAANVQRVAQWLTSSRYPDAGPFRNALGREPFPLSKKIRDIALGESAHTRFEMFQLLCSWTVYGSEQGWIDAILDLAKETAPFIPGDYALGGTLEFSQMRMVRDPEYVPVRLDADRWADTIVSARNDAVRGLLLRQVVRYPDEAHTRKLAQTLLASTNPDLLATTVAYFSHVLKLPDLAPKRQIVEGRSVWINLDAALATLRAHFGL